MKNLLHKSGLFLAVVLMAFLFQSASGKNTLRLRSYKEIDKTAILDSNASLTVELPVQWFDTVLTVCIDPGWTTLDTLRVLLDGLRPDDQWVTIDTVQRNTRTNTSACSTRALFANSATSLLRANYEKYRVRAYNDGTGAGVNSCTVRVYIGIENMFEGDRKGPSSSGWDR